MPEVRPGRCPVVDGVPQCPPPTEIDCIKVLKVLQECKNTDVEKVVFPIEPVNPVDIQYLQCSTAQVIGDITCDIPVPGKVKVNFDMRVNAQVILTTGTINLEKTIHVFKIVGLSRAGEPNLKCQVDVPIITCLECYISAYDEQQRAVEVTCCIGKLFLFKLVSEVQLMIPSYGYCAEPSQCANDPGPECPEFVPVWPPYPPQGGGE